MENKFKVGDRVKVLKATMDKQETIGKYGTIIGIKHDYAGVEFDKNINGHDCSNSGFGHNGGKEGHCWNCFLDTLELVNDRVIFKDNATILFKDGKKYVAKCCHGDTYDREKGLLVCLAKAHGYTFNDLQEMLESVEAPKSKVREVKRHAKVGEYVKVVESSGDTVNEYKNGDILKIVKYSKDNGCNGNRAYYKDEIFKYLNGDEYVVLENYKPNKYKITLSEFLVEGAKIAVNLKNEKEFNLFIKECQARGHFKGWRSSPSTQYGKNYCLSMRFGHGYCSKIFYEENGCKVYNFNEVDLNN